MLSNEDRRKQAMVRGRDLVLQRFDKDATNRTIEARFLELLR
jgi:hypothetical protein